MEEEAVSAGAKADGRHQGTKALTTQHFQYTMNSQHVQDLHGSEPHGVLRTKRNGTCRCA